MIRDIELTNFKCFEKLSLRARNLTIIAGGNAAGKSSIIQSLLLLAQSRDDLEKVNRLRLDDRLVNLVSTDQILRANSSSSEVVINIDDGSLDNEFEVKIPNAWLTEKQPECNVTSNLDAALKAMPLFADSLVYLNANRLVPQAEYKRGNIERFDSRLGDRTGHRTVFRLQEALDDNEPVKIEQLKISERNDVVSNVDAWLSYILDKKLSVSVDGNPSDGKAQLSFNDLDQKRNVPALNMAFGNTYVLPIIVGVLTAAPGSMIIVENPEAHLHPKAQLRLGEFLAVAAQAGIQIIIETHSDHLLNGVRVAAKKKAVDPINVAIHFIEEKDGDHIRTEIELQDDGTLTKWPAGFFDEWENALRDIISD